VTSLTSEEVVRVLGLEPHPEGGWFRETFRDSAGSAGRAHSTAIYYLLKQGERSAWHRIDSTEIWHWYAGDSLEIFLARGDNRERHVIGSRLANGERPQVVVPRGVWQSARSLGSWTLIGCTVAPGFEFKGFELAPDGFG
jgi:uncharacterized protein